MGEITYKEWVEAEARKINSDKCTLSLDWNVWCCLRHDLSCYYGKDPLDAYLLWRNGELDCWAKADKQPRREADKQFWQCNREMVKGQGVNWFKKRWGLLRTDFRYLGVRVGELWP